MSSIKAVKTVFTTAVAVLIMGVLLVSSVQAAGGLGKNGTACANNSTCANGFRCVSGFCRIDTWGGYGETTAEGSSKINEGTIQTGTGLGSEDPRAIVARVVNVVLAFLGIIAVGLILAAGFMWMTAAGNDDKIGTAKKIMAAGVVGLVIVLAAFGIAHFVVNALVSATTTG